MDYFATKRLASCEMFTSICKAKDGVQSNHSATPFFFSRLSRVLVEALMQKHESGDGLSILEAKKGVSWGKAMGACELRPQQLLATS